MIKATNTKLLLAIISLCLISPFATAKDITHEQRNAYDARKLYNKNKSAHENLLKRIADQEKRLSDEQTRLNQLKADEAAAKAKLKQSKSNLDEQVRILNDVWELRGQ